MTGRMSHRLALYAFFAIALCLNGLFWTNSRTVLEEWDNVGTPPTPTMMRVAALGDDGMAYRLTGYTLQNIGNTAGRFESLKKYDYAALKEWLMLSHVLDDRSNYTPFMASYIFGPIDGEPERTRRIVEYLEVQGRAPYPDQWRWFAQAVYLSRYYVKDDAYSLKLAHQLADMPGVAAWARQMPAFVQLKMGDKEAAYAFMLEMLKSEAETLDPAEVNAMIDFICTQTLDKAAAAQNPLCQPPK